MSTLVLVTPGLRNDGSGNRFSAGHLRELADRFERVVVVVDRGPDHRTEPGAWTTSDDPVSQTNASLETVLGVLATDRDGPGAAVIIDGDIRAVRRAGIVAREHAVPALWWCDGPPADEIQRETLQLIDAVLAPVDEASIGRYVPIGAGIDTRSLGSVPLAPRPPLRLLVLGRAVNQGGLAVTLRALAESRARGTDAHLILVDSVRISSRSARQTAESLIADLSLTQSVELIDGDGLLSLPRMLRRVHAVIDAGTDTEVDHEVLEAMAYGRAVVSSRPAFTPLLADESLPLVYAIGDSMSLAACITALADARHDELVDVAATIRARVMRQHSLDRWGASVAAVVEALQSG